MKESLSSLRLLFHSKHGRAVFCYVVELQLIDFMLRVADLVFSSSQVKLKILTFDFASNHADV